MNFEQNLDRNHLERFFFSPEVTKMDDSFGEYFWGQNKEEEEEEFKLEDLENLENFIRQIEKVCFHSLVMFEK